MVRWKDGGRPSCCSRVWHAAGDQCPWRNFVGDDKMPDLLNDNLLVTPKRKEKC